jgi:hypothetical protein
MYLRDGTLLARYPHIERMIGSNVRSDFSDSANEIKHLARHADPSHAAYAAIKTLVFSNGRRCARILDAAQTLHGGVNGGAGETAGG